MKKQIIAAAVLSTLMSGAVFAQQAQEGPWMVRVRAVNLDSENKDRTGLGLTVNNKIIPDFDVSYFFSKNFAAELLVTIPQKHNVASNGAKIGTLRHLPPTLLAQYHFELPGFKPYVGAGVNYTRFSSVKLLGGAATVQKNSFGPALQVGVDIPLAPHLYLNFDIKKIYLDTTVSVGGVKQGTFNVDPLLYGVGLGWRF